MSSFEEYPESGYPYQFYFNGEILPKWSAQWCLAKVWDEEKFDEDLDEFISIPQLTRLYYRIDHVGCAESECPKVFRVCAQFLLIELLKKGDEAIKSIDECIEPNGIKDTQASEIYSDLVNGLTRMIFLVIRDGYAFWTSGHQSALENLNESIRCSKLDRSDPEFCEPPHVRLKQRDFECRLNNQIEWLNASTAGFDYLDENCRNFLWAMEGDDAD